MAADFDGSRADRAVSVTGNVWPRRLAPGANDRVPVAGLPLVALNVSGRAEVAVRVIVSPAVVDVALTPMVVVVPETASCSSAGGAVVSAGMATGTGKASEYSQMPPLVAT